MPTFTPQALHALVTLIVSRMGSSPEETEEVADHLVRANLAGHDSHGVGMLPAYVRLLQDGLLVPEPDPAHRAGRRRTAGDRCAPRIRPAHGGRGGTQRHRAGTRDRRLRPGAAQRLPCRAHRHLWRAGGARGHGVHRVRQCRRRSRHPGALGLRRAATRHQPVLHCRARPAGDDDGPALLLDMATTTIAAGKARVAFNKGVPVPDGCLIDAAARPTNDPAGFIRDRTGAMLSFGRHKGSGLAVMCEIMAGAIGGGQRVDQPIRGGILNSMLATVIDLSRLGDPAAIAQNTRGHQVAYPLIPRRARVRRSAAARRAGAPRRTAACGDGHRGGCDDLARHPGGRGEARHHRGRDRPGGERNLDQVRGSGAAGGVAPHSLPAARAPSSKMDDARTQQHGQYNESLPVSDELGAASISALPTPGARCAG